MVISTPADYNPGLALLGNPANGIANDGSISGLSLSSGADSTNNEFPETLQLGTLSGFAFSELVPGSASFNPKSPASGEAAIAGATVTLTNSDGQQVGSPVTTSATGAYQFTNIPVGTYTLTITPPTGYYGDTALVGTQNSGSGGSGAISGIKIENGTVGKNNDFGLLTTASLSGYAFSELTPDSPSFNPGDPADGEAPVSGAVVTLTNSVGQVVGTLDVTGSSGAYQFTNLQAGTYTLTATPPNGYSADKANVGSQDNGTPGTGSIEQITLDNGTNGQNNDFGLLAEPASLSGYVFSETMSGSPAFNPTSPSDGEAAVADATVTLTNSDGQVVASTTTAATGAYQFPNLSAGSYTVTVSTPTGYSADKAIVGSQDNGSASAGSIGDLSLDNGADGQNNDFGLLAEPASLSGYVFSETTPGSLAFNPTSPSDGEAAFAGATVTLTNSDGQVVASTATDSTGSYQFANLSSGSYTLTVSTPTGYSADKAIVGSQDNGTPGTGSIGDLTLDNGADGQNNDFGLLPEPASLSGYVFSETSPGLLAFNPTNPSAGEAAFAGVTVTLTNSDGQVVASTTTGATGAYQFTNLSAGSYTVTVSTPTGYSADKAILGSQDNGIPGTGSIGDLSLDNGADGQNNDFGLLPEPASLSGYVFAEPAAGSPDFNANNPPSGETPAAGALVTLTNSSGSPIATTTTTSSGLYTFSNLPPGTYTLTVTPPTGFTSDQAFRGTQATGTPGVSAVSNIALVGGTTGDNNNFAIFAAQSNSILDLGPERFTVSAMLTKALTVTGSYLPPPVYQSLMAIQQPQPQIPVGQLAFPLATVPPAGVDRLLAGILGSGGDVQQPGGALPPVAMALPGDALDRAWELFGNARTEQWGSDEPIQSLLQKLADVDEMSLVSFEFGDDVVSPIGRNLKARDRGQTDHVATLDRLGHSFDHAWLAAVPPD